jgi:hypothetical protein
MTLKFFYWIMTNFVEDLKKTLSLFYKSFELVVLEKKKYILIFVIQKQELLMVSIFYYRSIQTV